MTSWVSWLVLVVIAVALGTAANHFSVRTVRWFTAVITIGLIVAVTTYGLGHPAPTAAQRAPAMTPMTAPRPPDLETAFARGADGIAAALLRPLWLGHQVPEPGRVGWVVIVVLLALGYRQLEAWAYRKQAPQLDTARLGDAQPRTPDGNASSQPRTPDGNASSQPADQGSDKRHDQLAAELKFRVAAMDVRSPSLLPGGSRSNGLASIAEASGVQGSALVGAIIQFFGLLWPGPRRWQLRVWVERGDDMRISVELDDPRSGVTVATKTLTATGLDDAASMVAGYVGRQVFASDPTSPPWCYGAADGNDLGGLLIARQQRPHAGNMKAVRTARRAQIQALQAVTRQSKCAGVVRYELAQLQDLEGSHLPALRLHALNREQYPRFFRGRYRLCMSLEMVTQHGLPFHDPDPEAACDTLTGILAALNRRGRPAPTTCSGDIVQLKDDPGHYHISDILSLELLKVSLAELRVLQWHLRLPVVLWAALRHRDERAVWRPHRRLRVRQAFRDGACVAELLVAVRIIQNPRAQKDTALPRTLRRSRFRHALRIAAAIAGDSASIEAVFDEDWLTEQPAGHLAAWAERVRLLPWLRRTARERAAAGERVRLLPWLRRTARERAATGERVRLLPWLRRTASWQAAYNTACIYSALAQRETQRKYRDVLEHRVVTSLQRAIDSRDSELERPYDWIVCDPDFLPLTSDWINSDPDLLVLPNAESVKYKAFAKFLLDQKRHDYAGQPQAATGDEHHVAATGDEHHDAAMVGSRDLGPAPAGTSVAGS